MNRVVESLNLLKVNHYFLIVTLRFYLICLSIIVSDDWVAWQLNIVVDGFS